MSNKAIYTAAAPSAIGPYSQGISAREYAFISGQLPIDPATAPSPVRTLQRRLGSRS